MTPTAVCSDGYEGLAAAFPHVAGVVLREAGWKSYVAEVARERWVPPFVLQGVAAWAWYELEDAWRIHVLGPKAGER